MTRIHPAFYIAMCTALLSMPLLASAEECKFQAPRTLDLDLRGIESVEVITNQHDIHVRGVDGSGGAVRGRACASKQEHLERLQVTQRRDGSKLVIEAKTQNERVHVNLFGSSDAYLDIGVAIPKSLRVSLDVGSGDADIDNVASLDANVGSGDLNVRNVRGRVAASVDSGDATLRDIGELHVGSVGSGDIDVSTVRADASIDTIGSGDAKLHRIGGNVEVGSIGSGDLDVADVGGGLHVRSIGSGDVSHREVNGRIEIPRQE